MTASKYAPPLHALSQHSGQGRLHAVAAEEEVCQAARDDNEAPQASGEAEQRLVEQNCRNFRRADLRIGDGQRAPRTVPTLLAAGQRVHTPLGGGVVKATKLGGWVVPLAALFAFGYYGLDAAATQLQDPFVAAFGDTALDGRFVRATSADVDAVLVGE